jgi:hypothetical protein
MHYFILHSNFSVELSQKEPSSGVRWKMPVYVGESYIDSEKTLTLIATFPKAPYIPPKPSRYYQTAVLKSNLQKAVRRGAIDAAVATAWQLVQQGFNDIRELFRRLPIILLEDGFLNSHILPRLVWWLLATGKGWICSEGEYQRLMLDVAAMASVETCGWREIPVKTHATMDIDRILRTASANQQAALFAIWLRSRWGGMLADVGLLRSLFHTWSSPQQRDAAAWSIANTDPNESCILLAPLESLRFDVRSHALPEAVDYHCLPYMSAELATLVGASKTEIEEALWVFRSSPNVRRVFQEQGSHTPEPNADACLFKRLEPHLGRFVQKGWAPIPPPSAPKQMSFHAFISKYRVSNEI